ncbi:MAG: NAD(+) diphosphatase [Gammaproteobacteria bacterium]|nr:NAD(+) diphosphatase [Gammaproteobacteria bacterium]
MSVSLRQTPIVWFIVKNNEVLLNKRNALPENKDVAPIASCFSKSFELGILNNISYFCAELGADICTPENLHSVSLRNVLSLLGNDNYPIAVKAYSIIRWDKNHQFCSRCGCSTHHKPKSFERICTPCKLSFFPKISPSIIVLIKKNDQVLMARSPHFPAGVYGLIAGFVEAGESLEEAVHREIKEEVGLEVKNLSYFGSQPWPFPDSLMVAFMADHSSGDIVIDQDEIEDAAWYKYNDLPGRPSMQISIASTLLDEFINSCRGVL